MPVDPNMLSHLPKKYEAQLSGAPRDEVGKCVEEYLSSWLTSSYPDSDELLYSGATVGRLRPDLIDEYASNWLEQDFGEKRLQIAGLFLSGYWPFPGHVYKPLVVKFLSCIPHLPRDSLTYMAVMLALSAVFSRQKANFSLEEFEHGRGFLFAEREVLRSAKIQPGLVDALDDLK